MWVEKHGATWRIRDRVGTSKVTLAEGYPTKTAANSGMVQLKAEKLRGEQLVPGGGKMTVIEWVDVWWPLREPGLKPSSRASDAGILRRYVRPMLGALALEEVDQLAVRRWVADLLAGRTTRGKPLAAKTVHNAHGLLHKLMADAVTAKLIRANPCEHTGLPEVNQDEMRFLTEPEAQRLMAAVPERWRPLVLLLLFTGLRWSEAVGLRAGRVDVLARKLTVVQTMQELADTAEIVHVTPKSKRSRRTVTFPTRVAEALIGLGVATMERDDLIFRALQGGPVRYRQFRRRIWLPSLARAGLTGLRLHDLRHTHAAWLISAGAPMLAISRRLGHASIRVTMDLYGHLLPEVDSAIGTALDGSLDRIGIDGGEINPGGTVGATDQEDPGATGTGEDEDAGQAA